MAILKRLIARIKGNRTRALGTALAIIGVLQAYIPQVMSERVSGVLMIIFGIAAVILRQYTNTPAGVSEPDVYDDREAA